MRLYNLSDKTRADRLVGRKARDLLINGQIVKPGGSIEVPDDFNLARVAGWINTEMICVGDPPHWYQKSGRTTTGGVDTQAGDEGTAGRDDIAAVPEQPSKKSPRKATKR